MKGAISARSVAADSLFGPSPHTLGVLMETAFMTGKNSIVPWGMEHVRVTVPPAKTPAKNHVAPRCPTMQSSPLVSVSGFTLVGMETAHCHHSALNSSRD